MKPPASQKTNELEHHDERTRSGLGEPEAIQHLSRCHPAVVLDGLLRDIGQHGVGSAESHHRGLAEKEALLHQGVVETQPQAQGNHRSPPESKTDPTDLESPGKRRPGMCRRFGLVTKDAGESGL